MNQSVRPGSITIPDGASATYEDMQNYGKAIQSYVCQTEAMLPSIKDSRKHDEIVDFLHRLAEGYNQELRKFKQAVENRRRISLMILWGICGE